MSDVERGIVIVGGGSLGQVYAALLAYGGVPVSLAASKASYQRLVNSGSIVLDGIVSESVRLQLNFVKDRIGEVELCRNDGLSGSAEGIIFATKGQDLAEAARLMSGVRPAWVMGVQNGLTKNEVLSAVFGAESVLGGATTLAAERLSDGRVFVRSLGKTYVGEISGGSDARLEAFVSALKRSSLPVELVDDVVSLEWSKIMEATAGHATGVLEFAISRLLPAPVGWDASDMARTELAILREMFILAARHGVDVQDHPPLQSRSDVMDPEPDVIARRRARKARVAAVIAGRATQRGSMRQDLEAGRKTEVEELFGDLHKRATVLGVSCPWLGLVLPIARSLNNRIDR